MFAPLSTPTVHRPTPSPFIPTNPSVSVLSEFFHSTLFAILAHPDPFHPYRLPILAPYNEAPMAPDLNSLPPSRSISGSPSMARTLSNPGEAAALRGQSPSPSPRSASTSLQAAAAVNAGLQQEDSRSTYTQYIPCHLVPYMEGLRQPHISPLIPLLYCSYSRLRWDLPMVSPPQRWMRQTTLTSSLAQFLLGPYSRALLSMPQGHPAAQLPEIDNHRIQVGDVQRC